MESLAPPDRLHSSLQREGQQEEAIEPTQRSGAVSPAEQLNPGYLGFRGNAPAAVAAPVPELVSVMCTVCQRKRNVPVESVSGAGEDYVCIRCQDDPGQDPPALGE